jgi:hypothetical protein
MIELLVSVLSVMCVNNLVWYIKYKSIKDGIKARANSQELDEFLQDMMQGGGVLQVKRVNPSDVLIRHRRS